MFVQFQFGLFNLNFVLFFRYFLFALCALFFRFFHVFTSHALPLAASLPLLVGFHVLTSSLVIFSFLFRSRGFAICLSHLMFRFMLFIFCFVWKLTLSLFIGKGKGSHSGNTTTGAWGDTTPNNRNNNNGSNDGSRSIANDDGEKDGFSTVLHGKRGGKVRAGRGGRQHYGHIVVRPHSFLSHFPLLSVLGTPRR